MKAIIYTRKSTDRGDRQQLSIESQVDEAKRIAKREWLEIIEIFKETESAKEPWRPKFNEMMKLFSKWKADCIITWKLNRIARNPIDEWTIKWSIQSWVIKAIFTDSEIFKTWDNVLIMWMHFWMSTQYILDLQKDIKRWMKSKMEKWGVCQKAPLGYINNRLEKSIEIDNKKCKWVQEIFKLRSENMAYKTISEILFKKWITKNNWKTFPPTTIESLLKNKFYIWLVKHKWAYYKWSYKTFISKSLFEKAQNIWQGISYRWYNTNRYYLKWLLKDTEWYLLSWYHKKNNIYYKSNSRASENININEKQVFEYFRKELESFRADENFCELNKEIILKILEAKIPDNFEEIKNIDLEIKKLESKKEKLLDLRLEWELEKEVFNDKNNSIVLKIEELQSKKKEIKNRNLKWKIELMFELSKNLYTSYNRANNELKTDILKNLMFELFVNSKKELSYAENSLYNCLKMLNFNQNSKMEVPSGLEPLWTVLQTAV